MIRVAIVAAMVDELKPLVRGWRHERRNSVEMWSWRFDEGEWVAACAGTGVDSAARAFAEIEKHGPVSAAISTGWAGALSVDFEPGRAYWASGVVDARTGERFEVAGAAAGRETLKGHGYSRALETPTKDAASLAAEMRLQEGRKCQGTTSVVPQIDDNERRASAPEGSSSGVLPALRGFSAASLAAERLPRSGEVFHQGRKPGSSDLPAMDTAQAVPSQSDAWLITSPSVAGEAEKQRLARAYDAGLVDMEAAAIARLARMRGIPFYCVKGVSDGFGDKLPDFNRFIAADGRFRIIRFVAFALLRPWYWPVLIRMGENGKRSAQGIAAYLLDFLDEQETIRKRNGYPHLKL